MLVEIFDTTNATTIFKQSLDVNDVKAYITLIKSFEIEFDEYEYKFVEAKVTKDGVVIYVETK